LPDRIIGRSFSEIYGFLLVCLLVSNTCLSKHNSVQLIIASFFSKQANQFKQLYMELYMDEFLKELFELKQFYYFFSFFIFGAHFGKITV